MALHADQLGVFAAVYAEGVAAHASCEEAEAQAPEDDDAANLLPGIWPVSHWQTGQRGAVATLVASEVDDCWPSCWRWGSIHGLRLSVHKIATIAVS